MSFPIHKRFETNSFEVIESENEDKNKNQKKVDKIVSDDLDKIEEHPITEDGNSSKTILDKSGIKEANSNN